MNYDELINTVTDVGYLLLSNGAEIYRVEESMQRLFVAYGVNSGEVFVIPTCINVTVSTPEGKPVTKIRRVFLRANNMDRVERANDLCRRVCRECPAFGAIRREVQEITARRVYGFWPQAASFGLIAFAFTLFFGGGLADAACAAVCGVAVKCTCQFMERMHANSFFINIFASFVAGALALVAVRSGLAFNLDKIIIGTLMNLVPGIVITSFMRDIMAGDLVAGLIRLTESLLVAAAIAIGAGLALTASRMLFGI